MIENQIKNKIDSDKLELLTRAEEKLRLEHNIKGKDFREGKMTQEEWDNYRNNIFKPRSKKLGYLRSGAQEKEAIKRFGKDGNLTESQQNELVDLKEKSRKNSRFDSEINLNEI
jgi:hypothetical protein